MKKRKEPYSFSGPGHDPTFDERVQCASYQYCGQCANSLTGATKHSAAMKQLKSVHFDLSAASIVIQQCTYDCFATPTTIPRAYNYCSVLVRWPRSGSWVESLPGQHHSKSRYSEAEKGE